MGKQWSDEPTPRVSGTEERSRDCKEVSAKIGLAGLVKHALTEQG